MRGFEIVFKVDHQLFESGKLGTVSTRAKEDRLGVLEFMPSDFGRGAWSEVD